MADIWYISTTRYRRIFNIECIFFDILLLWYQRFYDTGIHCHSKHYTYIKALCFNIEGASILILAGPACAGLQQLQAALQLHWYSVLIAVRISLVPGEAAPRRRKRGGGGGSRQPGGGYTILHQHTWASSTPACTRAVVAAFLWPTRWRNWSGRGAWSHGLCLVAAQPPVKMNFVGAASELEFVENLTAVKRNSPLTVLAFLELFSPLLTE